MLEQGIWTWIIICTLGESDTGALFIQQVGEKNEFDILTVEEKSLHEMNDDLLEK
jgi:hypothetical protein